MLLFQFMVFLLFLDRLTRHDCLSGENNYSLLFFKAPLSKTGCCPNGNLFDRSLKRFLPTNLGEVEDKRCQLFEP